MTISEALSAQAPPAELTVIERRADRHETPCGEGALVWRRWGSGPPLVLLHGAHGAWSHWIRNIDALAAERTVWVPDLPGCGDSAAPPGGDAADLVDALAAGLAELVAADLPVDLVGFSLGGVLGGVLAARHPDKVRRLVLVDAGGLDTPLGPVETQSVRNLDGAARLAAVRANLLTIMLRHPESVDALAIYLQETNTSRGRLKPRPFIMPDKLLRTLPQVSAQVDAIWGELDGPHPDPEVQAAAMRASHPDLELRVVPGAGHWVMYERAAAFNRALLDLLRQPLRDRTAAREAAACPPSRGQALR